MTDPLIEVTKQGDVFLLQMNSGENRFNPQSVSEIHAALDEIETSSGLAALVTTGLGKFYSSGLDLEFMGKEPDSVGPLVVELQRLFTRVLTFPMATAAAMNGHAFAAGAMLALAHDYRVMRDDRGWFCLPEVDINIPFTPLMAALIQARLPQVTAHEAMVTGKRYTASEAVTQQIVHKAASESEVVAEAVAMVAPLAGKDRYTMAAIKRGMYGAVLEAANVQVDEGAFG